MKYKIAYATANTLGFSKALLSDCSVSVSCFIRLHVKQEESRRCIQMLPNKTILIISDWISAVKGRQISAAILRPHTVNGTQVISDSKYDMLTLQLNSVFSQNAAVHEEGTC